MGAEGWRLALRVAGVNVTWRHRHLAETRNKRGFHLPARYQPWCSTQPIIALNAWDDTIHLYDVAQKRCLERPIAIPLAIQWAPRSDKLAVTSEGRITILDTTGERFDVHVQHPPLEWPEMFWWPDGTRFFLVSRISPTGRTRLSFFAADNGLPLDGVDFDPRDLVPYDDSPYRKVPRDTFSLQWPSGVWSVGSLLDAWSAVEFDPATQVLRAVVCRPVGPCREVDGNWTCPVAERGVEVLVSA